MGNKYYEIKNHTNNVQVVVTDYKVPHVATCTTGTTVNVEYYTADVKTYTDYFVFGGTMNNRNLSSNDYRYGFQGQERDNEIKGNDNSVNYEYRMHDPQYGRFLSIDPLVGKYPYWTPYQFSGNRLIDSKKLEGLEPNHNIYDSNKPAVGEMIKNTNGDDVFSQMVQADNNGKAYLTVYYNKNIAYYYEPGSRAWIGFDPLTKQEDDAAAAAATVENVGTLQKATVLFCASPLILAASLEIAPILISNSGIIARTTWNITKAKFASNGISALADFTGQAFVNIYQGKDIWENWNVSSTTAQLIWSNPFKAAGIGSALEFTYNGGFTNSVIPGVGEKGFNKWAFETTVGTIFNAIGNGVTKTTNPFLKQIDEEFLENAYGRLFQQSGAMKIQTIRSGSAGLISTE